MCGEVGSCETTLDKACAVVAHDHPVSASVSHFPRGGEICGTGRARDGERRMMRRRTGWKGRKGRAVSGKRGVQGIAVDGHGVKDTDREKEVEEGGEAPLSPRSARERERRMESGGSDSSANFRGSRRVWAVERELRRSFPPRTPHHEQTRRPRGKKTPPTERNQREASGKEHAGEPACWAATAERAASMAARRRGREGKDGRGGDGRDGDEARVGRTSVSSCVSESPTGPCLRVTRLSSHYRGSLASNYWPLALTSAGLTESWET